MDGGGRRRSHGLLGLYGNIVAAISQPGSGRSGSGSSVRCATSASPSGAWCPGVAITIGTDAAYFAVVLANAVSYAVAFVLLLAVPPTHTGGHRTFGGRLGDGAGRPPHRLLWFTQLVYSTAMMVLNFAMPVYAVTVLGLPGWSRVRCSRSTP